MSDKFGSRTSFVMAAVGAAVGLGNIFRFPALACTWSGAFILVYFAALAFLGLPLLLCETALGRMAAWGSLPKRAEKHYRISGGAASVSAFVIMCYYCVLFAFILMAAVFSYRLAGSDEPGAVFTEYIGEGGFPADTLLFLVAAWAAVVLCYGSAERLSRISGAGVIFACGVLLLLSVGFFDAERLFALFKTDMSVFLNWRFWRDAAGQVLFSLSVAVGVLPAFGGCISRREDIPLCGIIISLFDLAVSLLSTVIYIGVGSDAEGILACFSVYPEAFSRLFSRLAPAVSTLFYSGLALLTLGSAFSYLKSVSHGLASFFPGIAAKAPYLAAAAGLCGGILLTADPELALFRLTDGKIIPLLTLSVCLTEAPLICSADKNGELTAELARGSFLRLPPRLLRFFSRFFLPTAVILLLAAEFVL